jgi:hypothetical protein
MRSGGADETQKPLVPGLDPLEPQEKVYYFPAFSLAWHIDFAPIRNGERVVCQTDLARNANTTLFEVPEFQSRHPLAGEQEQYH